VESRIEKLATAGVEKIVVIIVIAFGVQRVNITVVVALVVAEAHKIPSDGSGWHGGWGLALEAFESARAIDFAGAGGDGGSGGGLAREHATFGEGDDISWRGGASDSDVEGGDLGDGWETGYRDRRRGCLWNLGEIDRWGWFWGGHCPEGLAGIALTERRVGERWGKALGLSMEYGH